MKQKRKQRGLRAYLCSMAAVLMLLCVGDKAYAYTTDTAPGVGQHLYDYTRHGNVPIYKWVCEHRHSSCIHGCPEIL